MTTIEKIRAEIERLIKKDNYEIFDVPALLSFLSTLEEEPDKSLEEAAKEYCKTIFHKPFSENPQEEQIVYDGDRYVGFIAGAKWQAEHAPLPEDTVLFQKGVEEGKRLMMEEAMSKLNLEEAAKKYVASIIYEHGLYDGDFLMPVCEDIFKAGAEWREEQHKSVPGKYAEMDFESARNTFSEDVYNHNRKNKTPIDMIDLDDAFETGADWMEKQIMKDAVEGEVYKYDKFSYVKEKNSKSLTELLAKFNNNDKVKIIIVKDDEKCER